VGVKEQLKKIKDNWFLIALFLVVFFVFFASDTFKSGVNLASYSDDYGVEEYASPSALPSIASESFAPSPIRGGGFAPEIEDRKITKTASLTTEVETGKFDEAAAKVKDIVKDSKALLLNEDIDKRGTESTSFYFVGRYTIKVETKKYEKVISQLKEIGEIENFNENTRDITERSQNLQIEVKTEKARLERYNSLFEEAEFMEDKIDLTNLIFNQESRIEYLEESLVELSRKVEYSTISLRITEKQSDFSDFVFVSFSELLIGFLGSFNTLISFVFLITPWVVALLIVRYVWKRFSKKKK